MNKPIKNSYLNIKIKNKLQDLATKGPNTSKIQDLAPKGPNNFCGNLFGQKRCLFLLALATSFFNVISIPFPVKCTQLQQVGYGLMNTIKSTSPLYEQT